MSHESSTPKRTLHPQFHDGAYYARKAAEFSATQTPAQNAQRKANGRKSNVADLVAILPGHEVADDFFREN
ncbi:MAG: hypothetical protein LCH81_03760 [Bacteroidetes bacterium]|nr:hypothetical protein [Bacteroidota bacterium]